MIARILLDPTADGGAAPAPAPAPAPTPAAPAAATIALPLDVYSQLQQAVVTAAQLQQAAASAEAARVAAVAAQQAEAGNWRQASETLRTQHQAEVQRLRDEAAAFRGTVSQSTRDAELTRALQGVPDLVPGAAEHLYQLWREKFSAQEQGGRFVVQTAEFQDPAGFIAAELAKPQYGLFRKAPTAGGAGGGGSTPAPAAPAVTPQTYEAQVMAAYRARQSEAAAMGFAPIGR